MPEATVQIAGHPEPLTVRINGANPTFRLASEAIRAVALTTLDDTVLDFLEIAATVFAADSSISRGAATRRDMGEAWRRGFAFEIPVRCPAVWSRPDVGAALRELVEFATEDHATFTFTQAEPDIEREPYFKLKTGRSTFRAQEVILFSGGLNSFAGALETLSSTEHNVVLVSHRSAPKVIPRQVELGKYLQERFPRRVLHVHVLARRAGPEARDMTQRSRSLLFAALGKAVARTFGAERLSFYENGIVSHNLPLSQQIVGTMATRTTHPLVLTLLNRLLGLVWDGEADIQNRFQWLTKTEVVRRIAEFGGANLIPKAVSCTSIREQTTRHTHCGACTQCLDRRFAILAAGLERFDKEDDYKTDVLFGPRETLRSRTMAVEWTRHALRFGHLDPSAAMAEFGLELSRVIAGHPGLPSREVLGRALDMHRRHCEAVKSVLAAETAKRAPDLACQELPSDSLIVMHAGQAGAGQADPGQRYTPFAPDPVSGKEPHEESAPDAGAPLEVAFFKEAGRCVIAARGLGRVSGSPAMVAHGLKPAFDDDRAAGRTPDLHRFVQARDAPQCETLAKETFRQYVRRCRAELSEFYKALHGVAPEDHILIQGRYRRGYRLDPSMTPIARDRL